MAKVGRFKNEQARADFMNAYAALEARSTLEAKTREIPTSFGTTQVRQCGQGTGTPIVLLHPFGGNGLYWDFVAGELADDRVVYALDTIGTAGKSVQTAPIAGDADFAGWFGEVLTGLGIDRAHVVGLSQGAWHTALVGSQLPQRVASVTLIEPNGVITKMKWSVLFKILRFGINPSEEDWRKMNAWITPGVTMSKAQFDCAKASLGYRTRLGWARVLKDAELRSFSVPMLAIFGGESVACDPVAAVRRINSLVPNADTEIYPGMGHGVLDQIPERVVPRILKHVRRHDHSPASNSV
ncbi:alpha/beta fold hydrolase [Nocardia sp. NPDC058058]|uniref:alpha/beta fold hydrolase n=1 Tax=Nocardia sp. NPDC058058 TaxID=3346317 RepID=UPI0036DB462F